LIIFGTAVTDAATYDRYATPGIRRAAEPDSIVFAHQSAGTVFRNYNLLLDKAAPHENLEALVLVHQDVEIADPDFAATVREALSDPDVAIVGCAGAIGVRSIAWWQGALTWAGLTHRYQEYGGGDFPAISWRPEAVPSYATTGEVDSIDGFVMVLSPWAVRELRFDESLGKLHGYDFDICMQAKAAGKKVVTAEFRAIHHHSLELVKEPETWIQTYIRLVEKWDRQLPDTGADPRARAVHAEAEAACARAIMVSHQMREEAIARQLGRVERELDSTRAELEAARQELDAITTQAHVLDEPASQPPVGATRFGAIDHAVVELGAETFASLEIGQTCGQYAFYAIDQPTVTSGVLIDVGARRPGHYLLSTIEQAAERPGMRVIDGSFSDPRTVSQIGRVDAILLFDVLHRMVAPDWDQALELYAPATSTFVIGNPQWQGDATVRLIDLGRDHYLAAVPKWDSHAALFDRLDEWLAGQQRPFRDGDHVWQWGITDVDLERRMSELGFGLERKWSLNKPPETDGFINAAFVFSRSRS
jgi:hypothetical protein